MKKSLLKNLKQLFSLTLLVLFTLTSCNNSNKIEDECEAFLKNQLNDPKSYERISIKLTDTFRTSDMMKEDLYYLEMTSLEPVPFNESVETLPLDKTIEMIREQEQNAKKQIEFKKDSITKAIEALIAKPNENKIERISCVIEYRAKNGMGALTKGKSILHYFLNETNPDKKIFIYSNK
jgi:hypothetical protein